MRFATANGPGIKELRTQRELTLGDMAALLAEKLGRPVNKATLSKIENNKVQPGEELFTALCEVLEGDKDQLRTIEVPAELAEHVSRIAGSQVGAA